MGVKYSTPFTFDEINSVLEYRDDGYLYWKVQRSRVRIGGRAGSSENKHGTGYWTVTYKGIVLASYRVVWLLCKGEWPMMAVDHKDGDLSNNSIGNLRLATNSQNSGNSKPSRADRYKGVWYPQDHPEERTSRYWVQCANIQLGSFESAEEAALAYDVAALERWGEFARFNLLSDFDRGLFSTE